MKKYSDFNPRSREGSDDNKNQPPCGTYQFQSTLPRGERPGASGDAGSEADFNPRSREGSDRYADSSKEFRAGDFNPRSREGSDEIRKEHGEKPLEFQSTLPRGERQKEI